MKKTIDLEKKDILTQSTYNRLTQMESSTSSQQVKALCKSDYSLQVSNEATTKPCLRREDSSTKDHGIEDNTKSNEATTKQCLRREDYSEADISAHDCSP